VPVALITGGSRGLGRALAHVLLDDGWQLVVDARDGTALDAAVRGLPRPAAVTAVAGDVADPGHRAALAAAVRRHGRLDLLVNNASDLGPSPLPPLDGLPLESLERMLAVNTVAPLAIAQLLLPELVAASGTVVNVSSDAAVEAYEGWGGYGASKAALDRLSAVLAVEQPALRVYAVDPGDMRTRMHQDAFPGEDISDRPNPETVAPALHRLVTERPTSGRYRAADIAARADVGA
jgi:NAD(P)-dependent dehydrogenase (short-subunit alcohol dehydrogenase family)